jgi:type III secretory pathway component EscS
MTRFVHYAYKSLYLIFIFFLKKKILSLLLYTCIMTRIYHNLRFVLYIVCVCIYIVSVYGFI